MDIDNASLALAALDTILCIMAFGVISGMFPILNQVLGIDSWLMSQQVWMVVALLGALIALEAYARTTRRSLRRTASRMVVAGLLALVALVLTQPFHGLLTERPGSLTALVVALAAVIAVGCLARVVGLQLHVIRRLLQPRVLVFGTGDRARRLDDMLGVGRQDRIAGFLSVTDCEGERRSASKVPAEKVLEHRQDVAALACEQKIRTIVTAVDDRNTGMSAEQISNCVLRRIEVIEDSEFFERATGRVDLTCPRINARTMSISQAPTTLDEALKRLLDITLSTALLIGTLPLLISAAVAIKLTSPGPVLFRQQRVGQGERQFEILKLRTMAQDAEKRLGRRFAQKNDKEITRVGYWLRRTRIDELPQLINVLKGDMSLVGPRPEQPGEGFVKRFERAIPSYRLRHQVRPGLTGWAQVNSGYAGNEIDEHWVKTSYDLFYLKNRSILFDLVILAKTAHAVVFGDDDEQPPIQTSAVLTAR